MKRARGSAMAAMAAGLALAAAGPAAAGRLTVVGSVSHSAAISGDATYGGAAFEFALMAPARGAVSVGLGVRFDDMGEVVVPLIGESGENLGSTQELHVASVGWDARMDAHVTSLRIPGRAVLTATTGMYSVGEDQLGESIDRVHAWGFGLGGSWRLPLRSHLDLGPVVRFHQLLTSDETLKHYWRFGLEAAWH